MKYFLTIYVIALMFFISKNAHAKIIFPRELSFNINDTCEEDGYNGTIQRFVNCELAIAFLKEANVYPKIYYFDKFEPIICCIGNIHTGNKIDESKVEYQNALDGSIFTIDRNLKSNFPTKINTHSSNVEKPSYFQLAHAKIIFPRELSFNINDTCEEDGYNGTIQRFVNCELAIAFLKEANVYPKIYYFDKFEPIICCIGNIHTGNKIDESKVEYQNALDGSIFTIDRNLKSNFPTKINTHSSNVEKPSYFQLEEITCTTEEKQGILSQFKDCPIAISKFKNQSIRPEIFTFKGLQPVICCVK